MICGSKRHNVHFQFLCIHIYVSTPNTHRHYEVSNLQYKISYRRLLIIFKQIHYYKYESECMQLLKFTCVNVCVCKRERERERLYISFNLCMYKLQFTKITLYTSLVHVQFQVDFS